MQVQHGLFLFLGGLTSGPAVSNITLASNCSCAFERANPKVRRKTSTASEPGAFAAIYGPTKRLGLPAGPAPFGTGHRARARARRGPTGTSALARESNSRNAIPLLKTGALFDLLYA